MSEETRSEKMHFIELLPEFMKPMEIVIDEAIESGCGITESTIDIFAKHDIFFVADMAQKTEREIRDIFKRTKKLTEFLVQYLAKRNLPFGMEFDSDQKELIDTCKKAIEHYYDDETKIAPPTDKKTGTQEVLDEGIRISCPECGKPVVFTCKIGMNKVEPMVTKEQASWKQGLQSREIKFIERIQNETHILQAFESVWREINPSGDIGSIELVFKSLFNKISPVTLSPHIERIIDQAMGGKKIFIVGAGDVSMLFASNLLRMFIPTEIILGGKI